MGRPTLEVCNGVDDDGDELIDEEPIAETCGVGPCRTLAVCDSGVIRCVPGAPRTETCNLIDDDCDDAIDEGLGFESLGPPIVLWQEPAQSVYGADLVRSEGGLLVAFRHTVQRPTPSSHNQTTLRVGFDGLPLGSPLELETRFSSWGPRLSSGRFGRVSLASCGNAGSDSYAYSAVLDGSTGALVRPDVRRSPTDRRCGAAAPDGLFFGDLLLYGWVENSSAAEGNEVLFDVADAAQASVRTSTLTTDGDLTVPPRFATDGERVALAYGLGGYPGVPRLEFHVFTDPIGPLPPPLDVPLPEGLFFADPELLPARRGFVMFAKNRFGDGLFRVFIDANGRLIEPPTQLDDTNELYSSPYVASRPGGEFALATIGYSEDTEHTAILALDEFGRITTRIRRETRSAPLAALGLDDGRVAVLFREPLNNEEGSLTLEFFGCPR